MIHYRRELTVQHHLLDPAVTRYIKRIAFLVASTK
jgi:hypothetical protein